MTHQLLLLKGKQLIDITPICGPITRRSNKDELGEEVSFDVAVTKTPRFPKNPCEIGDVVLLLNDGKEITRTIITDEQRTGQFDMSYTSFDYAFYLNKSEGIYNFKKMTADRCIRKVLSDFNVPIGNIVSIPVAITHLFNGETISNIIDEILEMAQKKNGIKHRMEMRQGKLYIERQRDLVIQAKFKLTPKGDSFDSIIAISDPSRSRSIADMVNVVQVVNSDDKLLTTQSNVSMRKKYGRLQKVVKMDKEDRRSAKKVAEEQLKELAKVTEEASITLLGDDSVRAGRLLNVNEPVTGIQGTYVINDVSHTINDKVHTMTLGLGAR